MVQVKYCISWILWPALMMICIAITAYGFFIDMPIIYFNLAYVFMIIALLFLERWMPHEEKWISADGQTFANIAHTLLSKGVAQGMLKFTGLIGLAEIIQPMEDGNHGIWPVDWPIWAQAALGLVAAEFGLYWAHRIAHEWPLFWRLHAIHHSVRRLWVINTGRFHFLDSLWKIFLGAAVLAAMGAPMEVFQWVGALTAYFGLLTHCNVEMRFGLLNYIFSTPGVHRWHHSMNLTQGDMNYGENVVVWDILFGTFYNESHRPPAFIGIPEYMPPQFIHQLIWPFLSRAQRAKIQERHPDHSRTSEEIALAKIT